MEKIQKVAIPVVNQLICDKFEQAPSCLIFTILLDITLNDKLIHISNEDCIAYGRCIGVCLVKAIHPDIYEP